MHAERLRRRHVTFLTLGVAFLVLIFLPVAASAASSDGTSQVLDDAGPRPPGEHGKPCGTKCQKEKAQIQEAERAEEPLVPDAWRTAGFAGLGGVGVGMVAYAFRGVWLAPTLAGLKRIPVLLGLPLYSRLGRRDVADHPVRERILAALERKPGSSLTDLATEAQIALTTAVYHMRLLERHGFVKSVRAGRNRLYFGIGARADEDAARVLAAPARRALAETIVAEPGLHAAALASRSKVTRATALHHLDRLSAAGLVRLERGLRTRAHPTPRLVDALGRSPPPRLAELDRSHEASLDEASTKD